jgi:hypothetical protein
MGLCNFSAIQHNADDWECRAGYHLWFWFTILIRILKYSESRWILSPIISRLNRRLEPNLFVTVQSSNVNETKKKYFEWCKKYDLGRRVLTAKTCQRPCSILFVKYIVYVCRVNYHQNPEETHFDFFPIKTTTCCFIQFSHFVNPYYNILQLG